MTDCLDIQNSRTKWSSITLLCICQVLAMTLWFSASVVVPSLRLEYELTLLQSSLFTSSVQIGFVVGTLISAFAGLADRFDPRTFFALASVTAGITNATILWIDPSSLSAPLLRFFTGLCMAGIYPIGMKMAATWSKGDVGTLVGLLVGALTLGSASPYLVNAFGGFEWRYTIIISSLAALIAAALIKSFTLGDKHFRSSHFRMNLIGKAWTVPSIRLANLGYIGHMWELYAMWAWIGVFLQASFTLTMTLDQANYLSSLAAFITIASGVAGCIVAGVIADRIGRTSVTMAAMAVSGACSIIVGFFFNLHPLLLTSICLIWGITIVADSAQFSASIAELSAPSTVGTMLTVQTSAGFLITLVTIHAVPYLVDLLTWRYAFSFLAIGPLIGIIAMGKLHKMKEPALLSSGNP